MASDLILNLTVAFFAALIGGAIALRLRLSAVVGYVAAGVAIGPFTPGFAADPEQIRLLADIGIVLLMFGVGVQFSLRDLFQVRGIAVTGALVQVPLTIGLGVAFGLAWGWPWLEALFFGAIISISSTAVVAKLLSDRGESGTLHGRITIAWLLVQDILTIFLIVALSALAQGTAQQELTSNLVVSTAQAAAFIVGVLALGGRVLPPFLGLVARTGSRELFLLAVTALALGTAFGGSLLGVSPALGAFLVGLVISQSDLSHHVLGEVLPTRDLFAVLFFVSLGMLVEPQVLIHSPGVVMLALAVLVAGKALLSTAITLLQRYPLRTALFVGMGMGNAAEFSFVLARIGSDLGAVSDTVFSLVVASAVASILLTPLLFHTVHPVERFLASSLGRLAGPRGLRDPAENPDRLRGHAIVCGYGRVGSVVAEALRERGLRVVVIEQDRRRADQLRRQGLPVVYGSAANPYVLAQAHPEQAVTLVAAIEDPLATRQLTEYAQRLNPRLDVVARVSGLEEETFLRTRGIAETVIGEREVALELSRHALRRFGITGAELTHAVQGLRARLEEREHEQPPT